MADWFEKAPELAFDEIELGIPSPEAAEWALRALAFEQGISGKDERASLEAEVERVLDSLGDYRRRILDLRARAVLHSPQHLRGKALQVARSGFHALNAEDLPKALDALATGRVENLRAAAERQVKTLCALSIQNGGGYGEAIERYAAIAAFCRVALEALSEGDTDRLRKVERCLRKLTTSTPVSALSRPRKRGPCAKPSRHLSQAVRRSNAPPVSSGHSYACAFEGAA